MSNENDDLDNEEDETETGNAPKVLRKQNSDLTRQLAEEREARGKLEKDLRKFTLADFLTQHGAESKLAKYVPAEVSDSDGVLAWLKEDGDVFGWQPTDDGEDEDGDDTREQAARISRATRTAPDARTPTVTPEWIKTASRDELVKAGVIAG